ncbi:MAG: hypothetical protein LBR27_08325 [Bifidobacteriaceae bacterium]|jgi:hypothetical protein|nr:hypothetical protein [Bifidobacteriaceae bacterium]
MGSIGIASETARPSLAVRWLVPATIVVATAQNPLLVLLAGGDQMALGANPSILATPIRYLDDLLILLLAVALFPRLTRFHRRCARLVVGWAALVALAVVHAIAANIVPAGNAVTVARQVLMPVLIIGIGASLRRNEWRAAAITTLALSAINAPYTFLEWCGIRLFPPANLGYLDGGWVYPPPLNLPYNFVSWSSPTEWSVRLGGLLINPPTLGIFAALSASLTWWLLRNQALRYTLALANAMVCFGTISRAGIMILLVGLLGPYFVKRVGRTISVIGFAVGITLGGTIIATMPGSTKHVTGLVVGLTRGLKAPLGEGFGKVGNLAKAAVAGESLLGIAFSAMGWLAIALVAAIVIKLVLRLQSSTASWVPLVQLGALLAAALAETGGAVYGTIPMWLFFGYALVNPDLASLSLEPDRARNPKVLFGFDELASPEQPNRICFRPVEDRRLLCK